MTDERLIEAIGTLVDALNSYTETNRQLIAALLDDGDEGEQDDRPQYLDSFDSNRPQ